MGFPGGKKNPPAKAEVAGDVGLIPGSRNPLELERATHSSILAWKIPWTEEPGGLQSIESPKRVGHDLATKQQPFYVITIIAVMQNVW